MVKGIGIFIFLMAALGFEVLDATASGFGFYGSSSSGSSLWDNNAAKDQEDEEFNADSSEFGLVFDSNTSRNNLFNYRLNLGYLRSTYAHENSDLNYKIRLGGFAINNTFGFGILRTAPVRVWFGPQIGFSWQSGSDNQKMVADLSQYAASIAPVLGMNVNIGKSSFLTVEGGYRFARSWGDTTRKESFNADTYNYYITERAPFMSLALLFRFGE